MKRRWWTITSLVLVGLHGGIASAQDVDVSSARVVQLDTATIRIDGIRAGERAVAVDIRHGSPSRWTIDPVDIVEGGPLPPRTVLDFASIRQLDSNRFSIEPIFVEESAYRLVVGVDSQFERVSSYAFEELSPTGAARTEPLARFVDLVVPQTPELDVRQVVADELEEVLRAAAGFAAEARSVAAEVRTDLDAIRRGIGAINFESLRADVVSQVESVVTRIDRALLDASAYIERSEASAIEFRGDARDTAGRALAQLDSLDRRIAAIESGGADLAEESIRLRPWMFVGAAAQEGAWSISETEATQDQTDAAVARLPMIAVSGTGARTYRIEVESLSDGFAAGGIELGLSHSDPSATVPRSIVAWVARDPEIYGDAVTLVELYGAFSTTDMRRLAAVTVDEAFDAPHSLEVTFDRTASAVVVVHNGAEAFRYRFASLPAASSTALRALGRVRFANPAVQIRTPIVDL